jgi:hypothetical protein
MTLNNNRVRVKALWLDNTIGLHGYIGAVLADGQQVALCSKEKWDMGPYDSLRFTGNRIVFNVIKHMYLDATEQELRARGLDLGRLGVMEPIRL